MNLFLYRYLAVVYLETGNIYRRHKIVTGKMRGLKLIMPLTQPKYMVPSVSLKAEL
jgi:hypothetical protein